MLNNSIYSLLLAIAALTTPLDALASDFHSPRTAALGGSGHAGPLLNDSIYLNPSFSSFLPTYSVGTSYLKFTGDSGASEPKYYGRNYSVSVQDGRSELFQAGAAYARREDATFLHLGASRAFVQSFGFGVGGKFRFDDGGGESVQDFTFATTWVASQWLQVALIVDNVIQNEAARENRLYREVILATKVNLEGAVLAYLDPHYAPSVQSGDRLGYEAGLEFVVFSDFFLRVGKFQSASIPHQGNLRGRGVGFGAGWVGPRLALDYGVQRVLEPRHSTAHTFGGTIFF